MNQVADGGVASFCLLLCLEDCDRHDRVIAGVHDGVRDEPRQPFEEREELLFGRQFDDVNIPNSLYLRIVANTFAPCYPGCVS